MTGPLKLILAALFVFQLFMAGSFELSFDEAYYWLFSQHLDWGYFDHPPAVAVVIRMFSLLPQGELSVRLGFILLQFLTLLTLFRLAPERKGLVTLLFFSFPLASLSGIFALPDMPLLFMTAAYCLALRNYLRDETLAAVIFLGATIAFLLYCKYHGVLLIFFTLVAVPSLLRRRSFYLVSLVSLVLFAPHLWWQSQHDFSSVRYHLFDRPSSEFRVLELPEFFVTQILSAGLLVGPVVWWTVIKNTSKELFPKILKYICIGSVLFFALTSLVKNFEVNWTIFLAVPLILLSLESDIWDKRWAGNLLKVSLCLVISARLLLLFPPQNLGIRRLGEIHGWKDWTRSIKSTCGHRPIITHNYQLASKFSYYLQQDSPAFNYRSRSNQFDLWGTPEINPTEEVCYITNKFTSEEFNIFTPDGINLILITDRSLKELNYVRAWVEPRSLTDRK
ncbi:MAG TPA: glycosyltransferase family 39 protein [Bacteriovoracaceae bacterium]|nr:glycosyltransferase family 39 protein [Bacteriovoracaceae bacterium]